MQRLKRVAHYMRLHTGRELLNSEAQLAYSILQALAEEQAPATERGPAERAIDAALEKAQLRKGYDY
jgi:hypothetical protein